MSDPDRVPPSVPRLRPAAWSDPAVLLVTGFGSGFLRPAPGTWGTLVALAIWWYTLSGWPWPAQLAVVVGVFALGLGLCRRVARRYGVHDDPGIVLDEFVGLWLTLLAAPPTPAAALAGFVLFRALDIAKPWPVGWADRRVRGALGVMLDDVIAGGLAGGVLQLAFLALAWAGDAATP